MAAVPQLGRASEVEGQVAPEAAATEALYARYGAQILRYCRQQLGSREEAEDAAQTTFMNAFRGLSRGIEPEAEQAWLYAIAQNVCLSRRRSSWRRGRVESPHDLGVLQEVVPAPAAAGTDELMRLRDSLAELPEMQRRAILLREWQGLSYREIGEELELSQSAVETLIFRARRSLALGLEQAPLPAAEGRALWRRARKALDLGSFFAAAKALLAGATAVKAAATTAAAVTVTVAALEVERERPPTPVPAPPGTAAPAPARPAAPAPVRVEHAAPVPVAHVSEPRPVPVRSARRPARAAAASAPAPVEAPPVAAEAPAAAPPPGRGPAALPPQAKGKATGKAKKAAPQAAKPARAAKAAKPPKPAKEPKAQKPKPSKPVQAAAAPAADAPPAGEATPEAGGGAKPDKGGKPEHAGGPDRPGKG